MCLVQIRFQLQNESIAFEPKESVVRSLHYFHVCQAVAEEWRWSKQTRGFLWPKQGCSLGEREVYIKPGTDKTTMRVFNQSSKVYQSRTEKKKRMQKKNHNEFSRGRAFLPTSNHSILLCALHKTQLNNNMGRVFHAVCSDLFTEHLDSKIKSINSFWGKLRALAKLPVSPAFKPNDRNWLERLLRISTTSCKFFGWK